MITFPENLREPKQLYSVLTKLKRHFNCNLSSHEWQLRLEEFYTLLSIQEEVVIILGEGIHVAVRKGDLCYYHVTLIVRDLDEDRATRLRKKIRDGINPKIIQFDTDDPNGDLLTL